MLNISENVTINGNVMIEGNTVINMSASVYTDGNNYPNINITVQNKESYKGNFDTCKQGINEFVEKVLNKQYESLGGIINEA